MLLAEKRLYEVAPSSLLTVPDERPDERIREWNVMADAVQRLEKTRFFPRGTGDSFNKFRRNRAAIERQYA